MCRSVGDVEEQSHLTKSKTKPIHQHLKHQQDEGDKKQNKMMMKLKMMRRKVSPSPVPAGCFPVYVGPEENDKQRFVVKAEMANHPLFRILLEEAETKYGLKRQGPIWLPCDVDLFYKVLAQIDMDTEDDNTYNKNFFDFKDDDNKHDAASPLSSWNFIGGNRLSGKLVVMADFKKMTNNNINSYSLLNQSKLLKSNR